MLVSEESTALLVLRLPLSSSCSSSTDLFVEDSEPGARAGVLGWRWSLGPSSPPMAFRDCGMRSEPRLLTRPTKSSRMLKIDNTLTYLLWRTNFYF
jgi:hypothetical protein